MKKVVSLLLACILVIGMMAGCGNSTPASTEAPAQNDAPAAENAPAEGTLSNLRVAAVFTGPRGDSGTIDMVANRLEKLEAEEGLQIEIVEGDGSMDVAKLTASVLDTADEGYDLIVSTGTMSDVFRQVAPDYPETTFCLYDTTFDFSTYDAGNIYCANFLQNEGAYLAGMLAMSMSKTGTVGFIGGMENANICDFMWGYVEGAKHIDPQGTVAISFTGDWMDSAKAKEICLTQAGMNADVIYPASGPCQEGAYEGAAEAGIYAIGVDNDREALYANSNPDWVEHILTSALKCVDAAVERTIRLYATGELQMGQEALGISEGGVDLCLDGNFKTLVPEDVQKRIEDAKQAIINGEIEVGTAIGASAEEIAAIKEWAGKTE